MNPASLAQPSEASHADDMALMRSIAKGTPGAFEVLVDRFQQPVGRFAQRLLGGDTDDVTQDVFVTVLEKAGRFRGDCSIWTWLTRITLNQCRNRIRRRRVRRRFELWFRLGRHESPASDAKAVASDESTMVRRAIAALPVRDREVIVLAYLEGLSPTEIAELLSQSVNSIEVRLHRARGRLREILSQSGVKS
jgi:RNA polymerase sigma factor (sigma-70 family)